jgi:protease-4
MVRFVAMESTRPRWSAHDWCRAALPVLLAVGALAGAPPARAQAVAVAERPATAGVALPPTGAALADEATAPEVNPAGLGMLRGPQLFYLHERDLKLDSLGDALFAGSSLFHPLAAGLALQWIRPASGPDYRKTSWTLAAGVPTASLGLTLNLFGSDDAALDRLATLDAGLLLRPFSYLSLGVAAQQITGAKLGGQKLPTRWDLGLGLRPLGRRATLGGDLIVDSARGFRDARLSFTAAVEPLDGFVLQAGLSAGLHGGEVVGQLALTLNASHAGFTYAAGSDEDFSGVDHLIQLRLSADRYPPLRLAPAHFVLVDVQRELSPARGLGALLVGTEKGDPYLQLLAKLGRMAQDPSVAGVVLKLDELGDLGPARTEELRAALAKLRASGKRAAALVMGGGDREYLIAAACDRIYAVPQASLAVNGYTASKLYLAEGLDRLGITVDVARVGAYKNAPDTYTRSSMSPQEREVLNAWLDGLFEHLVEAIASARKLTVEQVRSAIDAGILGPEGARRAGLIDAVLYPDELPEALASLEGRRVDFALEYPEPATRPRAWGRPPTLAVVGVLGLLSEGKSRSDPFGLARVAGAETILKDLGRAYADPDVAAVVLRIDSPGGSGTASDLIWRAVRKVRERKPVVVSMGDYAASGGYYVAMAADEVFAEPSTLTGSIGVFALKPSAGGLLEKLGVHREVLARGEKADLFSLVHPWTPSERQAMQRFVEEFYDGFITRVAQCRGLEKARVDELARGRVYSGEAARKLGLVDSLGGLPDALAAAQRRAGLSGRAVAVEVLGGDGGAWRLPLAVPAEAGLAEQLARRVARDVAPYALWLAELPDGPLALLPFQVAVE